LSIGYLLRNITKQYKIYIGFLIWIIMRAILNI